VRGFDFGLGLFTICLEWLEGEWRLAARRTAEQQRRSTAWHPSGRDVIEAS
jgi:hypothetical protein